MGNLLSPFVPQFPYLEDGSDGPCLPRCSNAVESMAIAVPGQMGVERLSSVVRLMAAVQLPPVPCVVSLCQGETLAICQQNDLEEVVGSSYLTLPSPTTEPVPCVSLSMTSYSAGMRFLRAP